MGGKCNYGHSANSVGLEGDSEIVDFVCDLLGQRFTKCQIKTKIREKIAEDISLPALEALITTAKRWITERYKIDASMYRGFLVAELERLLRLKIKTKERIKVIHELADLLGLRSIGDIEAPADVARKIREAINAMDKTIQGQELSNESKDVENGQKDAG